MSSGGGDGMTKGALAERVAVIVPAMKRPGHVAGFMESLSASTDRATAYFICDPGDVDEQVAAETGGATVMIHDSNLTTFAVKVNFGYRTTTEPWLLFVGDDVRFRPGWVEACLVAAGDQFHLVGTNDLSGLGQRAVHPVVRRTWLASHGASWDGPGIMAHEGYRHCFVDNEWTAVAKQARAFVYAEDAIIEHLHPEFDKGELDDTYLRGRRSYARDQGVWNRRSAEFGASQLDHIPGDR